MKFRSDVRCRSIAGEGIILCQEQAEVLVVNGIGARIVELLQREFALEDIVKTIQLEYDIEAEVLRQDVMVFLDELEQAAVLEPESD